MAATLTSLRIRNLALVEDLLWEPAPGFLAVTGETGAGKSIILGALKLVIGERADRALIRTGAAQCIVEAVFTLDDASLWNARLDAQGLDPIEDEQLVIRRQIAAEGAGRQFVNGSPVALAVLRELGAWLVDLHGPHDHQSLFSTARQLEIVDLALSDPNVLNDFASVHRERVQLLGEIESLSGGGAPPEREIDLLHHQLEEIQSAALRVDEEETLHRQYHLASNAKRLAELAGETAAALGDDESGVSTRLSDAVRGARDLARLDAEAASIADNIEQAATLLQEAAADLGRYADDIELEPAALAALEARVNLVETLKRKYGGSIAAALEFAGHCTQRLEALEGRDDKLKALRAQLEAMEPRWRKRAATLSAARRQAAASLEKAVARHLADLGFLKAEFHIAWETLEPPQASGAEQVEFLFSPNPGEPAKALRTVASSGEVSRVMLAIKSALAASDTVGLLVFDEIDANVGGEIAVAVGHKLASLATSRQVFCITHLPQVAALANDHWLVKKSVENSRTISTLDLVKGEDRIHELARMLGGRSKEAILHAKALLDEKPVGLSV